MKKKFLLSSIFILSASFLIFKMYKIQPENNTQTETNQVWSGHQIKNKEVISQKLTIDQARKNKLRVDPITKPKAREPSSKTPNVFGDKSVIKTYINTPSKDWKKKFAKKILRFFGENSKAFIKEEESLIEVKNGVARHLNQVVVTFLSSTGRKNIYRAHVDSETGQMVRTWDRTIHEDHRMRKDKVRLTPQNL